MIEILTFAAGLALLVAFFQVRAEQESRRAAGVEAFLAANANSESAGAPIAARAPGPSSNQPDQSLWSENRIDAYAESHEIGGDAPLALLSINRLAIEVPVYDGADEHNLNRGVARVRGTARIDVQGNLGIAGHRDGFFRGLKDIRHGDVVELATPAGLVRYEVVSTQVVEPHDVGVLAPTDERTLTLVTCFPFYFVGDAPQRFIVKAVARQSPPT